MSRGLLGPGLGCATAILIAVGGCAATSSSAPDRSGSATTAGTAAPAGPSGDSSASPAPAGDAGRQLRRPLAGRVVVLDPGHQLGNHNFPSRIDRPVPAGGFTKPCNTTGTSTDAGYPEATFTWRVAKLVQHRLTRLGARVILTRHSNSQARWGPCVDVRGRAGNHLPRRIAPRGHADLKLSIHGDGSYAAGAHGFHVIAPTDRRPWTADIYRPSRAFALTLRRSLHRAGLAYATYTAGGDGLDFRSDLATLNLSDIPTVLVELGNMRDAGDARRMTSHRGQTVYADALTAGIRARLTRRGA